MKAKDVVKILDQLAPPSLAYKDEELGFIVGDGEKEVGVLGVTERPTVRVLKEAVGKKVDMLVIHEPLYTSEKTFLIDPELLSFPPNLMRKSLVQKGDFVVFRYHSQWDDADEGNNEVLVRLLGITEVEKIPYGRVGTIKPIILRALADQVKNKLECNSVLVVGDFGQKVNKIAVVAGSGNSLVEIMELVKQKGAEVLISGDITDGRARFAKELGLCIIDAGDYNTEKPGALKLVRILQKRLPSVRVWHLDPGVPWQTVA
jgi:dinuclear metal center YbgI/SA1388 family protein